MTDPAAYEEAIAAVGLIAAHLRRVAHGVTELAEANSKGRAFVESVVPAGSLRSFPPETVLDAACAIRQRELVAEAQLASRRAALAEAAEAGSAWARLGATSSQGPATYRDELLVHLESGTGILCTVELDVDSGNPMFVARPVAVDTTTGAVLGTAERVGPELIRPTPEERRRDVDVLMSAIESVDNPGRIG
jgi:hypothetical protein